MHDYKIMIIPATQYFISVVFFYGKQKKNTPIIRYLIDSEQRFCVGAQPNYVVDFSIDAMFICI